MRERERERGEGQGGKGMKRCLFVKVGNIPERIELRYDIEEGALE